MWLRRLRRRLSRWREGGNSWLAAARVGICIVHVDNMVGTRASTRLRAATKEELNTPIPNMPDEDHEDREEEEEEEGEETEEVVINPKLGITMSQ